MLYGIVSLVETWRDIQKRNDAKAVERVAGNPTLLKQAIADAESAREKERETVGVK